MRWIRWVAAAAPSSGARRLDERHGSSAVTAPPSASRSHPRSGGARAGCGAMAQPDHVLQFAPQQHGVDQPEHQRRAQPGDQQHQRDRQREQVEQQRAPGPARPFAKLLAQPSLRALRSRGGIVLRLDRDRPLRRRTIAAPAAPDPPQQPAGDTTISSGRQVAVFCAAPGSDQSAHRARTSLRCRAPQTAPASPPGSSQHPQHARIGQSGRGRGRRQIASWRRNRLHGPHCQRRHTLHSRKSG